MVSGVCQSDNVQVSTVAVEASVKPEVIANVITAPVVVKEKPLLIAEQPAQTTQQVTSAATNSQGVVVVVAKCQSYQIELSGVCVISIPSCQQYNMQTLKCKVCKVGFTLSTQGFCIPESLLAGLIAAQTQAKIQALEAATPNLGQSKEVSDLQKNQTSKDCI